MLCERSANLVHYGSKQDRLFFRAFISEERQVIIVLWLGYPRKAGDKQDCYEVFTKMVGNGDFPDNLQELLMAVNE